MIKRLAKDVAIYGAGDMVFRFISFATFPIYANLFSVEQFGIMMLVSTLAGLISVVLMLGMNSAVERYYWDMDTLEERRPVLVSTGLGVLVLWSSLVTALLLLGMYPFRGVFDQRYDIQWLLLVLALAANIPALLVTYCLEVLRFHFSPWWYSVLAALQSLAVIAVSLFLVVVLEQGLLGFFLGQFLALILIMPLGLWLVRRDLRWRFNLRLARELTLFGYPFIFVGLSYWVTGYMDRWMLAEFSDNTNVGLFSIAYKFAVVITFVTTAFARAWSPLVMKMYAEDPDYRDKVSRMFSYWFFGLAFIGVVISLFGYEILRLTTPETYWPAATMLGVLVMGLVLLGTTQFTALGISLARRTRLLFIATLFTGALNFLLNLVLIPMLGALGSGIATFVSYAVLTGLYLYWAQRLHPLPLETRKLLFSLSIVLFVPLLVGFLNSFSWDAWIVVAKLIACGLVLFLGFATRTVKFSDIRRLSWRGIT